MIGAITAGLLSSGYSPPVNNNSYESIATVTVGIGGAANAVFASIPSSYKQLQIRGIARSTRLASNSYLMFQVNSDTGNNYANHGLYGNGTSAGSYAVTTTNHALEAFVPSTVDTASAFGGLVVDILDYQNTSKYKTFRGLTGADINSANSQFRYSSGVWLNTNAITSITIVDGNGANLEQYSSFALYGIKG